MVVITKKMINFYVALPYTKHFNLDTKKINIFYDLELFDQFLRIVFKGNNYDVF